MRLENPRGKRTDSFPGNWRSPFLPAIRRRPPSPEAALPGPRSQTEIPTGFLALRRSHQARLRLCTNWSPNAAASQSPASRQPMNEPTLSGEDNNRFIGVAGWSIPARYAAEIPQAGSHLERYAHRLNAVEINSSFYRSHRLETYTRWAASTPCGFRFAVKVPRGVTHERRLIGCDLQIDAFATEIGGLGSKLGLVLLQLPPSLTFEQRAAGSFLTSVRARIPAPIAIEPRHLTWFTPEVDRWLCSRRVARVAADPPIAPGGDMPGGWLDLRYHRRHGAPKIYFSDYDDNSLRLMNTRLREDEASGAVSWCIFDNTASGAALGNALTLTKLLARKTTAPRRVTE